MVLPMSGAVCLSLPGEGRCPGRRVCRHGSYATVTPSPEHPPPVASSSHTHLCHTNYKHPVSIKCGRTEPPFHVRLCLPGESPGLAATASHLSNVCKSTQRGMSRRKAHREREEWPGLRPSLWGLLVRDLQTLGRWDLSFTGAQRPKAACAEDQREYGRGEGTLREISFSGTGDSRGWSRERPPPR